jgi:diketogulonate reductase-like aldo/keto reductase
MKSTSALLSRLVRKMAPTSTLTTPLPLSGSPSAPSTALPLPRLIYGTAWKKDRTATLVHQALRAGFRAIDTAAQPKHYREDLVAEGIRLALSDGTLSSRQRVFIQTKFTPVGSQDENDMPYDLAADLETQIRQSVESSLQRFSFDGGPGGEVSYIDCVVLHTQMPTIEETLRAWAVLESFVPEKIHHLGISNTTLPHLEALFGPTTNVKPSVVQNRLVRQGRNRTGTYESSLYAFCKSNDVVLQSFWTLTANPHLVNSDFAGRVAEEAGVSNQVALYALLLGIERWTVLNGTTNEERMVEDLESVGKVERWADGGGKEAWLASLRELKNILGVD